MSRRPRGVIVAIAALTSLLATACSGGEPTEDEPGPDGAGPSGRSVGAELLPGIAHVGPRPAPADRAGVVVTAWVTPAEKGVALTLERDTGSGWQKTDTAETSASGTADFVVDGGAKASYRVSAANTERAEVRRDSWALSYSDEFPGNELDTSVWWHRGTEYNPAGLRACSKGSPEAADVAGGVLNLRVAADPARVGETCQARAADGEPLGRFTYRINGHVANNRRFLYGITSARIKFPREKGQHGSLWFQSMLDINGQTNPEDGGAEIDVVESFGDTADDKLASFVYYPTPDGLVKEGDWIEDAGRFLAGRHDDWWRQYHVFSLEWTEEEYVVRIDGREAWRTDQGVSQQPESLILSLLSSDYELPKLKGEDKLPQSMQVDWVRHWTRG